nr:MAG TPA: hypothetical protein [Caudoviricetes sp.]
MFQISTTMLKDDYNYSYREQSHCSLYYLT